MNTTFLKDALCVTIKDGGFGRSSTRIILASCMALALFTTTSVAWASDSKNPTSHRLINQHQVQEMKERVVEIRERRKHHHNTDGVLGSLEALQAKIASLETSLNAVLNAEATLLTNLQTAQAQISTLQSKVATLEVKPAGGGGIQDLEKYLSINHNPINGVNGPHIIFKGVNVHVTNGLDATTTTNGLGNLIVGYNESASGIYRNGSHNLVGGSQNGFSSYGGLVFGTNNKVSGQYSSVLGGGQNEASGPYSTVYGGQQNTSATNYDIKPQMQSAPPSSGGSSF